MIRQDFPVSVKPVKGRIVELNDRGHVWEVRHAGLLGIKYEVAVRSDLVNSASQAEPEEKQDGKKVLRGVVDAAVLGYVRDTSLSHL